MDNRKPRSLETREQTGYQYQPPSSLPTPEAEDGYGFRWVATAVLGQADPSNTSKRFREGWEPVKAADHPELAIMANATGNVEMGGLILCKAPLEMIQGRERYYAKQAQDQIRSVNEHFMRESNPKMPLFNEHQSKTTVGEFGSGNK